MYHSAICYYGFVGLLLDLAARERSYQLVRKSENDSET